MNTNKFSCGADRSTQILNIHIHLIFTRSSAWKYSDLIDNWLSIFGIFTIFMFLARAINRNG